MSCCCARLHQSANSAAAVHVEGAKLHSLVTIPFSHYNERARWGLRAAGIPFAETPYMPFAHMAGVWWEAGFTTGSKADRASTGFSTPLLRVPDGRLIGDSGEILRYAQDFADAHVDDYPAGFPLPNLYPNDHVADVAHLEKRFHDMVGPNARKVAYYYVLQDIGVFQEIAQRNFCGSDLPLVARLQGAAAPFCAGAVRVMLRGALGVNAAGSAKACDRLDKEFDFVSRLLTGQADVTEPFGRAAKEVEPAAAKPADGEPRRYLLGTDQPTGADYTFATLASVALMVTKEEGYGAVMPSLDRMPVEYQERAGAWRASPAGQFALRLFREELDRYGGAAAATHGAEKAKL